jgi:hypothetical protein
LKKKRNTKEKKKNVKKDEGRKSCDEEMNVVRKKSDDKSDIKKCLCFFKQ